MGLSSLFYMWRIDRSRWACLWSGSRWRLQARRASTSMTPPPASSSAIFPTQARHSPSGRLSALCGGSSSSCRGRRQGLILRGNLRWLGEWWGVKQADGGFAGTGLRPKGLERCPCSKEPAGHGISIRSRHTSNRTTNHAKCSPSNDGPSPGHRGNLQSLLGVTPGSSPAHAGTVQAAHAGQDFENGSIPGTLGSRRRGWGR